MIETWSSDEVALTLVVAGNVVNRDGGVATVKDPKLDKAAHAHLGGEEAYDLKVKSHLIGHTRHSRREVLSSLSVMSLSQSAFLSFFSWLPY